MFLIVFLGSQPDEYENFFQNLSPGLHQRETSISLELVIRKFHEIIPGPSLSANLRESGWVVDSILILLGGVSLVFIPFKTFSKYFSMSSTAGIMGE